MGHVGWLVLAERWVVHKAGLQVPHCQVQPHGMLQKTPWPFVYELCFPDLCMDKTCFCLVLQWSGKTMQPGCHLQSAACWLFLCATPAAALKSSCCARPKLPAVVLGLGHAVLWRQKLYPHDDTSLIFWRPQSTLPVCSPRVCLCGKGYFGESSGALDWGECMGVALIWSSLWNGKMWDFSATSRMQARCW